MSTVSDKHLGDGQVKILWKYIKIISYVDNYNNTFSTGNSLT